MIDLRCPQCNALLLRFDPGEGVEGYCRKCQIEIRARRRSDSHIIPPRPVVSSETGDDLKVFTTMSLGIDKG